MDDARHAGRAAVGRLQPGGRERCPLREAAGPGRRPRPGVPGAAEDLLSAAVAQLTGYFSGQRRRFDLPIDWTATSRLQQHVLGVLFDSVGYGETVSYGTLAQRAGSGGQGPSLPPGPSARSWGRTRSR